MKAFRIILATILGGGLLYMAMRGVDFGETWEVLRTMEGGYLVLALVLVLISPVVRALRWRALFDEEVPNLVPLIGAIVTGQTLNFTIPFRSGEVARILMVGGRKLQTAGTIAVEKALDAACFAGLCVMLPLIWAVPEWLEGPRLSVLGMAGVYLVAVVGLSIIPRISPKMFRITQVPPLKKMPILLGSSLYLWAGSILTNYFVLCALQIQATFLAAIVLAVILQVGVAVPSSPGKIGVFQYLAVLGLTLFGVAKSSALAFGLILHLLVFVPAAIMALIFWVKSNDTATQSNRSLG
jgi:uncharacterized membrane protein YbhN (UPF0104 family)